MGELSANFQTLMMALFLNDKSFYVRWAKEVTSENFDEEHRILYDYMQDFSEKYTSVPTVDVMRDEMMNRYKSDKHEFLRDNIKTIIKKMKAVKLVEVKEYVEDKILQFVKSTSLKTILPSVLESVEDEPDKAIEILEKTLNSFKEIKGSQTINFFDLAELEKRIKSYYEMADAPQTIATLIPPLDSLLRDGGVPRKKLAVLSGPYNVGKTTMMAFLTKAAVMQGFKCLFITMEETKEDISNRMDCSFAGVSINELAKEAEYIRKQIIDISGFFHDNLYIWEAPGNSISVKDIDFYLESLKVEHGFVADFIAIDNLDSLKPVNRKRDKLTEVGDIWRDARALAQKRNLVLWSPSQVNRQEIKDVYSGDKEVATGTGVASSIEKMNIADLHITLNPRDEKKANQEEQIETPESIKEKQEQAIIIFVDKNRMGRRFAMFDAELNVVKNSVKWLSGTIIRYLKIGGNKPNTKKKKQEKQAKKK